MPNIFFPHHQMVHFVHSIGANHFTLETMYFKYKKGCVLSGEVDRERENYLYLQKFSSTHQNKRGIGGTNAVTFLKPWLMQKQVKLGKNRFNVPPFIKIYANLKNTFAILQILFKTVGICISCL